MKAPISAPTAICSRALLILPGVFSGSDPRTQSVQKINASSSVLKNRHLRFPLTPVSSMTYFAVTNQR
jgi:hypothetical protein